MSSTAVVMPIEPASDLEIRALSVPDQAKTIHVKDQNSYTNACRFLIDVVAPMRREVEETFDPICKKMSDAHREATAQRKRHLSPLEEAESTIKLQIATYELQQRRLREAEECAALAEQERLHAEQIEAAIEAAELQGAAVEEIKAIIEQPVVFTRPVVAVSLQKVSGVTTRRTYKARVTNLKALCLAIAQGNVSSNYVIPNETALNATARAQGPEMAKFVPGIVVEEAGSVGARRK